MKPTMELQQDLKDAEDLVASLRLELKNPEEYINYPPHLKSIWDTVQAYDWYNLYKITEDGISGADVTLHVKSTDIIHWDGVSAKLLKLGYYLHRLGYESGHNSPINRFILRRI